MTRALVALAVLALAWPAMAQAQPPRTIAPPGNSAIDQYLETVPAAGGSTRPRPPGQGAAGGALTPAQRERLARLGADGRTLAGAVDRTAPATAPARRRVRAGGPAAARRAAGRAPPAALLRTFGGSDGGGGLGLVLPAIMVAALLAAITLVLRRRHAAR